MVQRLKKTRKGRKKRKKVEKEGKGRKKYKKKVGRKRKERRHSETGVILEDLNDEGRVQAMKGSSRHTLQLIRFHETFADSGGMATLGTYLQLQDLKFSFREASSYSCKMNVLAQTAWSATR